MLVEELAPAWLGRGILLPDPGPVENGTGIPLLEVVSEVTLGWLKDAGTGICRTCLLPFGGPPGFRVVLVIGVPTPFCADEHLRFHLPHVRTS
jgi:hypothetical protein